MTDTDKIRRYKFTLPKSEHSPNAIPRRGVYGFVVYMATWMLFGVYLIWAIVPHEYLNALGFTYLPSRWWAIVGPWLILFLYIAGVLIYLKMNARLILPLSSIHLICDDASSELSSLLHSSYSDPKFQARQHNLAFIPDKHSTPPMLDISHDWICKQLYLRPQTSPVEM